MERERSSGGGITLGNQTANFLCNDFLAEFLKVCHHGEQLTIIKKKRVQEQENYTVFKYKTLQG